MKLMIDSIKIVFGLFFSILGFCFNKDGFIGKTIKFIFFGINPPTQTGSKFLSNREQEKILNINNKGLLIDGNNKRLSEKISYTHIAVIAKTGAGKTTSFIYPNLFTLSKQNTSIVVSDPSGELFATTSEYMKSKGFSVLILDPLNLDKSIRYNPIANIKTFTQVGKITQALINSSNSSPSSKDNFWNNGAKSIIEVFIQCLMNLPLKYRNLHNVLYLLQKFGTDGSPIERFIKNYSFNADNIEDMNIYNKWLGFISNTNEVRSGFLATAKSALKKIEDPNIAKLTASNTIDFKDFRQKKTILYLSTPSHEANYYTFILNLFYSDFFSFCMEQPYNPNKDLPIYVLYDEFGHSSIPDFSSIITTIRKYGVSISIILQSLSQLEERYGKIGAETILSGGIASKLFYAGADLHTAFTLQNVLGKVRNKYQYKDGKEEIKEYNLLNADEIRTIKDTQAIFITGNEQPILLDIEPYYKNYKFRKYAKLGESKIQNNINDKLEFVAL